MNNENITVLKDSKIKRKRDKFILVILVMILIIVIYNIVSPYYIAPNEIRELNENIDLPYDFGAPFSRYNISEDKVKYDNGIVLYLNNKNGDGDSFGFKRYPDLSSSYKFANYGTTDPQISLFGLKLGDCLKKVDRVLKDFGYYLQDIDTTDAEYCNGKVSICVSIDVSFDDDSNISDKSILNNGHINGFSIQLESTDWFRKGNYK